ncbi:hypothetical protein OROGR_012111 [Orobanche gracilis]
MCGKIKEFQGKRSIQNGLHCCKIMFNPSIPIVIEFKEQMLQRHPSLSQGVGRIVDASKVSLEDDFLNLHERKTLAELKEAAIETENCYIVEATIKYLLDPQAWWYNVCNCNKAVQPDSVSYYCGPCDRRVDNVKSRYQIRIKVIDETDSTNFVIFDRAASILLNRSYSDLIASYEKTPAGVTCPVEIINPLDKKFLFKVEIRKDADGRFEPSYNVKRVTDDVEILAKFRAPAPVKESDTSEQSISLSKCSMAYKNMSLIQPLLKANTKVNGADTCIGETVIVTTTEVHQSNTKEQVICLYSQTDDEFYDGNLITPNKRLSEEFQKDESGSTSTTTTKLIKKIKQEKNA